MSEYYHNNAPESNYAHFHNALHGLEIRRRDNGEKIFKHQLFNEHSWYYLVQELKAGKHDKYILEAKKGNMVYMANI